MMKTNNRITTHSNAKWTLIFRERTVTDAKEMVIDTKQNRYSLRIKAKWSQVGHCGQKQVTIQKNVLSLWPKLTHSKRFRPNEVQLIGNMVKKVFSPAKILHANILNHLLFLFIWSEFIFWSISILGWCVIIN